MVFKLTLEKVPRSVVIAAFSQLPNTTICNIRHRGTEDSAKMANGIYYGGTCLYRP